MPVVLISDVCKLILSNLGDLWNQAHAFVWVVIIVMCVTFSAVLLLAYSKGYLPLALWAVTLTVYWTWHGKVGQQEIWRYCEFGALISIIVTNEIIDFFRFFLIKFPDGQSGKTLSDLLGSGGWRAAWERLAVTVPPLLLGLLLIKGKDLSALEQLGVFCALYAVYLIANLIVYWRLRDGSGGPEASTFFRSEVWMTITVVDLPFLMSYLVLSGVYIWLRGAVSEQELHAFVGGASVLKMVVQGFISSIRACSGTRREGISPARSLVASHPTN